MCTIASHHILVVSSRCITRNPCSSCPHTRVRMYVQRHQCISIMCTIASHHILCHHVEPRRELIFSHLRDLSIHLFIRFWSNYRLICSYVCATSPVHQHNVYDCLSSYTVSSRCITGPCSSCPHTRVRHVLSLKKMSSFRRALALKNLFIHMKKNNWPGWRGCKPRRKFLLFLMTSRCSWALVQSSVGDLWNAVIHTVESL